MHQADRPLLPTYILAGGRSRRFGSDKTRHPIDGVPLILRLARLLAPIAATITAVARRPDQYADFGIPTIADRQPDLGPLGGLHTAMLHAADPGPHLVIAGDTVVCRPAWIDQLHAAHARYPSLVTVFRTEAGRNPFPGLYQPALAPLIARQLAQGRGAMREFLDCADTMDLPQPSDAAQPTQINCPADLNAFPSGD